MATSCFWAVQPIYFWNQLSGNDLSPLFQSLFFFFFFLGQWVIPHKSKDICNCVIMRRMEIISRKVKSYIQIKWNSLPNDILSLNFITIDVYPSGRDSQFANLPMHSKWSGIRGGGGYISTWQMQFPHSSKCNSWSKSKPLLCQRDCHQQPRKHTTLIENE